MDHCWKQLQQWKREIDELAKTVNSTEDETDDRQDVENDEDEE